MIKKDIAKKYIILFDAKIERSECDELKSMFFAKLESTSEFHLSNEFYRYKNRTFLRSKIDNGELQITHHEWGLEYQKLSLIFKGVLVQ